jgi:hypothetical protein
MPSKGIEHPYCANKLGSEIVRAGSNKIFLRSDNEPAIKALVQQMPATLRKDENIEAVPDPVREGDSNANGAAEGAVKEIKAKARVIAKSTQEMLNIVIDQLHWCIPFLVLYAVATINRGRGGPDGLTPYELRYGRPWEG